ncbi:hypothetical protein AWB78_08617 [Caballeronia calidae]|uniref:Uncharacterized protein n=2 Tax=Caballeronia calidae TaxID=1777139 RepID=A0A158EKY4_9BURK|nr:hypothetical protein AWB78_08617 [Caballeronia calidae]
MDNRIFTTKYSSTSETDISSLQVSKDASKQPKNQSIGPLGGLKKDFLGDAKTFEKYAEKFVRSSMSAYAEVEAHFKNLYVPFGEIKFDNGGKGMGPLGVRTIDGDEILFRSMEAGEFFNSLDNQKLDIRKEGCLTASHAYASKYGENCNKVAMIICEPGTVQKLIDMAKFEQKEKPIQDTMRKILGDSDETRQVKGSGENCITVKSENHRAHSPNEEAPQLTIVLRGNESFINSQIKKIRYTDKNPKRHLAKNYRYVLGEDGVPYQEKISALSPKSQVKLDDEVKKNRGEILKLETSMELNFKKKLGLKKSKMTTEWHQLNKSCVAIKKTIDNLNVNLDSLGDLESQKIMDELGAKRKELNEKNEKMEELYKRIAVMDAGHADKMIRSGKNAENG